MDSSIESVFEHLWNTQYVFSHRLCPKANGNGCAMTPSSETLQDYEEETRDGKDNSTELQCSVNRGCSVAVECGRELQTDLEGSTAGI